MKQLAVYEYDASGNLTRSQASAGGWQRFEYDAAGRLVNVKTDNNVLIASYTYGASNQRLITTEGNLKTYYAWAGDATIAEYTEVNSSGIVQWSKSYVYLGARLLATLQPNGNGGEFTQYHHPDRLGTRLITNAQDTSVQEQVTLPYGTALDAESTGASNRRFTSYDRSISTGLDYAVNRHYDSMQGRFTQVDPIGMGASSLENPQTLNMYAYCGNDPINHTDPNGLFWGKLLKFWAFGILSFKSVRHGLKAVFQAVSKVLNNRWVRIGVLIASFVVPFLGPLASLAQTALNWYNRVSDIIGEIQLAAQLVTGKIKEFAISLGLGAISSALATLEDGIVLGLQKALGKVTINGEDFINWKNFSFKKFFGGVWSGFKQGLTRLSNRGWLSFTPIYNFCGAGTPDGDLGKYEPVDGFDKLCRNHDEDYKNAQSPEDVHKADETIFRGLFGGGIHGPVPKLHIIDVAFGGRPSAGSTFKFGATIAFGLKSRF